ncbi:outer membrane protein, nutrient binding [Filimonas lacunae]|nr:outer membrane protein, nutrient binding [Filimonas lacunae]
MATGFSVTACHKQLETAPTNAVPEELLFKNVTTLNSILEGSWASMMDEYYGGVYANPGFKAIGLTSDAMGNDVAINTSKYAFNLTYPFSQMNDKTQSRVNAFWTQLYKLINNMNIILAHVDAVPGDAAAKKALKGQALALRAHLYTTLASFYQFSYLKDPQAKVVPLYTTPSADTTKGRSRATLQELYTLVIGDLTEAVTLLDGYSRTAKYKIDKDVANGLLARACLFTGQWQKAADAAGEILNNYSLMAAADYGKGFNDITNKEWVWGHPEIPSQNVGSDAFHFLDVSSASSGYYSFNADPYFMELFEEGDIRKTLFQWNGQTGREGYLLYKKFLFRQDQTGDLVLMRSAEAYLIKAEGLARNNQLTDAAAALNQLRAARNAQPFDESTGTQQSLIDAILVERRKELWGEGFSLSDIIRNQLPVVRKAYVDADGKAIQVSVIASDGSTKTVAAKGHTSLKFPDGTSFVANSPYYLFAIPLTEEQNNPNLYK